MANLLCTSCKIPMQIITSSGNPIRVIGSAICSKCGTGTGFEIESDTLVYVSGKSSYGSLSSIVTDTVKTIYAEAELCYNSGAPNAAAAMCRSSIDIALTEKGISGKELYNKIENAKDTLDDIEIGLAHATRLITRDAIHRGELISLSDVPSMLSATIRILNKLYIPPV